MKCKICNKETGNNDCCEIHTKAHENIIKKYEIWNKALEVSWKEYLSKIAENPLTGKSAKEVAEHLMKTGEK